MVMADANTMIRCIIGDDAAKAEELQEMRKSQKILYTVEVVAEVVYVLTKVYDIPREDCSNAIIKFLSARNIMCRDEEVVKRALKLFAENSLDFVDNILLSYHQIKSIAIYTYDKKLLNTVRKNDSGNMETE